MVERAEKGQKISWNLWNVSWEGWSLDQQRRLVMRIFWVLSWRWGPN